jgi:hypothetical protein
MLLAEMPADLVEHLSAVCQTAGDLLVVAEDNI